MQTKTPEDSGDSEEGRPTPQKMASPISPEAPPQLLPDMTSLLDVATDGLYITDASGRLLAANNLFARMIGEVAQNSCLFADATACGCFALSCDRGKPQDHVLRDRRARYRDHARLCPGNRFIVGFRRRRQFEKTFPFALARCQRALLVRVFALPESRSNS